MCWTPPDANKHKNTTQYVLDTTRCKQTQTTVGKDEPNIVFMRELQRTSQHGTLSVNTRQRTTKKLKR
jgi:hypothetical protein